MAKKGFNLSAGSLQKKEMFAGIAEGIINYSLL
jgi:hypothetical protein